MKGNLLYVEDDRTLAMITKEHLELNGYKVDHAMDGQMALDKISNSQYDLYILDVMLPTIDGFGLAQQIRKRDHQVPILFLSAKSMKEDRIHGLKIGGDDYITKPYSIEELILKIEIFLRRRNIEHKRSAVMTIGNYTFDYENQTLQGEKEHSMTQREAELLKFLWAQKNSVTKRSEILEVIWGEDDYFLGRSLDVFISRLRKYFKDDPKVRIENVHGVGFKLKC